MQIAIVPRCFRRLYAVVLYRDGQLDKVVDVGLPRRAAERMAWSMETRLPVNVSAAALPITWALTIGGEA
jgi:predicted signal transduction protein with EAL and GGDEF domain